MLVFEGRFIPLAFVGGFSGDPIQASNLREGYLESRSFGQTGPE